MSDRSLVPEMKLLASGGKIATLCRTSAAATQSVVFLHGIGSRASSFTPLLERMPARFELLAWDAPGYGASTPLPQDHPTPRDYADALASLLDAGSIDSVDLVGHSLGCLMAGAFARAYPARVRRVVLMSPALGYKVRPGAALPDGLARRIDDFERLGAEEFAATRAQNLMYQPERKPALVEAVRRAMATLTMPGYGQAVRMLGAGDLLTDAAASRHEVMVLNGERDTVTPITGSRGLHGVLRRRSEGTFDVAPLVSIAGAGHAVYLEAPDEVARAISDFLSRGAP